MKKFTLILCAVLFVSFSSCKKDNTSNGTAFIPSYSDKIVLSNLQASNDSVVLTWTKLVNKNFYAYYILRRNYKTTNPNSYDYYDIIQSISDPNIVKYTDHSVPASSYLEYQVLGIVDDTVNPAYGHVFSNIVSYERPGLKTFSMNPKQIIPDIANHRMYEIDADSGKISILDYSNKTILKTIKTNSTNGFCDLGIYNGVKELYVPRNDGWVFIYNASTLEKIDQISAGTNCSCVVYNNNQLFILSSNSSYNYSLYAVSRSTKAILSTTNSNESIRINLVPGSTTKLLGVSSYNDEVYSFEFNSGGTLLNSDYSYQNYSVDPYSFQIFPDGQHFITSGNGSIFSYALAYVVQLPHGNYDYHDFAFDQSGSKVFAGCSNYKCLVAYANPGFSELQTYHTAGYPVFIFTDTGNIISLSATTTYYSYGYVQNYIIEKTVLDK